MFEGSALSEVWAEFALRQVPLETSRKDRARSFQAGSPSTYFPSDRCRGDGDVFQAPLVGERLVPDASSVPG